MSTFSKEASGADKFFVAVNEVRPPFVIQLVLEGDGDPAPESLDDALMQATEANPGSSLMLDEAREPLRWTIGPPPTLTLVDAPKFDATTGEDAPFLMWALDARTGPTCELVFVRGKNKSYLIFRAIHAVMDGQGTLLWVKDFMRCLRGEAPAGHRSTLSVEQLIREISIARRPYPKADALHPYGPGDPNAKGTFHWRRVTGAKPLASIASGRIAVAIAERARAGGREGVVRINLPTDLRHYRPEERTTGNFFNALFVDVPPGATAEGIALKIVQLLYKNEGAKSVGIYSTDESGSLAAFRVKAFWDLAHMHDTGLYSFSATLSHLGVLASAELSAPLFRTTSAFFVPLVGDSGCVISLNGFDDHTEAAVGLSDRFAGGGHLEELAALIRAAIE